MYNYSEYETFWNDPISDYKQLLEPYLITTLRKSITSNILEIGFGSGHLPKILQSLSFSGNYLGIDTNPDAIKFAITKYPQVFFNFRLFTDYNMLDGKNFDLVIFCLSACEMSNDVITDYLQKISTKYLLIINPSTITNYFDSKIIKTHFSKITSRLGISPTWRLIANIPNLSEQKRSYFINNCPTIEASMYYRSTGDLLNLANDNNFKFVSYSDLKYNISTVKTAPVSKFEAILFKSI
jgi:hypothetical protein